MTIIDGLITVAILCFVLGGWAALVIDDWARHGR